MLKFDKDIFKFRAKTSTVAIILCIIVLAVGVYLSIVRSDFTGIKEDFERAKNTPFFHASAEEPDGTPDDPSTPGDPSNPDDPSTPDTPVTPEEPESSPEDTYKDLFDSYNPDFADINKQILSNTINNTIANGGGETTEGLSNVVNTYVDELYKEIDNIQSANPEATEEELAQARDEFAQKESEAFDGLNEIMTEASKGTAPNEETVVESVESVLDSTVCLNTVTNVVTNDAETTEKIQQATESMSEETKTEIENLLNSAYNNPENAGKEESYEALASLFGITLTK